jgi:hypothetical protein
VPCHQGDPGEILKFRCENKKAHIDNYDVEPSSSMITEEHTIGHHCKELDTRVRKCSSSMAIHTGRVKIVCCLTVAIGILTCV